MKAIAAVATTAALALAMTAPAGAGSTERFDSKVTIKDSCASHPAISSCRIAARRNYTAVFKGRVTSDAPRCERGRTVKVILVEPKPTRRGTPTTVGTVRSNENGRWRLETDKPGEGEYVAKVTRKRKGDVVCKPDTSNRTTHDVIFTTP